MSAELSYLQSRDCLKQERKAAKSFHRAETAVSTRKMILERVALEKKQKAELVSFLEDTGAYEVIFKALSSRHRLAILRELLRFEAQDCDDPMAFTELKLCFKHMRKSTFAYHLDQLQEAGLVRQLTRIAAKDEPTEENGYYSFYSTSGIAALLFEMCKTL